MLLHDLLSNALGISISIWKVTEKCISYDIEFSIIQTLYQLYYVVTWSIKRLGITKRCIFIVVRIKNTIIYKKI